MELIVVGLPGALGVPVLLDVGEATKTGFAIAPIPLLQRVKMPVLAWAWSRKLATHRTAPVSIEQ